MRRPTTGQYIRTEISNTTERVRVLVENLWISVNSCVGELIGKLGFLKPHDTC